MRRCRLATQPRPLIALDARHFLWRDQDIAILSDEIFCLGIAKNASESRVGKLDDVVSINKNALDRAFEEIAVSRLAFAQLLLDAQAFGDIALHGQNGGTAIIIDHGWAYFNRNTATVASDEPNDIELRHVFALETPAGVIQDEVAVFRRHLVEKIADHRLFSVIAQQPRPRWVLIDALTVLNDIQRIRDLFNQGAVLGFHTLLLGSLPPVPESVQPTSQKRHQSTPYVASQHIANPLGLGFTLLIGLPPIMNSG